MSGRLGPLLRDVAEAAPPVRLPDGLFDRARRRHRRRRAAALAATLAVLALLVLALPVGLRTPPVRPAAGVEGLPTRLVHAPGHTATIGRAPLPAVLAVFSGADSDEGLLGDSYPLTLVGPGDAYRTYERPEWTVTTTPSTPTFLLSPDGRYLAIPYWASRTLRTRLLDVTTGKLRTLTGGVPLAWAPDSRSLVLADLAEGTGPESRFATLHLVDIDTGAIHWQLGVQLTDTIIAGLAVAVSPDGTRVAVEVGGVLSVYQGDTRLWGDYGIGGNWLAGPAAWTPDGSRLAILDTTGLVTYLNSDGLKVDAVGYPPLAGAERAAQLVGWRGGQPVVITGNRVLLLGGGNAENEGDLTQLLVAPDGSRELQIAADALAKPLREPGPPQPGPALVRYRFVLLDVLKTLCAGGVAVLLLELRARRRRRREKKRRAAPARPGR